VNVERRNLSNSFDCDVIIVGAGPYGLSASAHLKSAGIHAQAFGQPMEFWEKGMPTGMLLRSPREASTISDPRSHLTLESYEAATSTKPEKRVPREAFVSYGKWFEKQLGAAVDHRNVAELSRDGSGFKAVLSDGSWIKSKSAVVAAGVGPFMKSVARLSDLSPGRVSHCYEGRDLATLGKRVAVIGAGQSALECAALLSESGVEVHVIARIPQLRWIGMHKRLHQLGPISKMLYSKHDVGPIGISRLVAYPNLMYRIPLSVKDRIRKRAVRSAGAPWLIPRLNGARILTGRSVVAASEIDGEVQLILDNGVEIRADHVLLGTGYQVDISRYRFLAPDLIKRVHQIDGFPDVGAGFSTSVSGLHFIGATAARKFGPLMNFVTGTEFASKELTRYMMRNLPRNGTS
jgi:FAD-dependent urate hydroxylase